MDGGSDPQPPQPWNESEFEARLSAFIKLWSRTFDPADTATIKATSFVSEIAPQLLNRACQPKALLVYVKPEAYLATILGGPNAREEAKSLTLARLARLHRRLGREAWRLASFSEGEGLAMSWLAEMSALASAHAAAGSRAHLLDFDAFLADPRERLLTAFRFFDVDATRGAIADILAGPLMRTYSKAPEHAYSPQLRADILDEARKTHAVEIAKGLAWLDQAAAEFPLVRDCLALAER
jgi:hypothetical protein